MTKTTIGAKRWVKGAKIREELATLGELLKSTSNIGFDGTHSGRAVFGSTLPSRRIGIAAGVSGPFIRLIGSRYV